MIHILIKGQILLYTQTDGSLDLPHVGRGQQAGERFTGRDAHLAEGVVTDLGPATLCASEFIHSRQANSYKCPLNMKKKTNQYNQHNQSCRPASDGHRERCSLTTTK